MNIVLIIIPVLLAGLTFILMLKMFGDTWLAYPLDVGMNYKNRRIFGKNKTIRGPLVMMFFTGLYGFLLSLTFGIQPNVGLFTNYVLVGLAYSVGELPNSFIKRQFGISPGALSSDLTEARIFRLIDNFDSVIACGIAYTILFNYSLLVILVSILIGGFLHFSTDILMIRLGIKKKD